uniref:Surface associated antigen 1 n=1 Tax=Teladorsagia circumcincta TaxID=45464 RepID=B2G3R0_TELCI|nr:surface associated antigen 1 precursor [Teladorsagia circumcincta]
MFCRVTVAVLLLAVSAHAGFFDDVSGLASDVGDFFTKQFNNVKDLFANNQSELEKNIQRVKDLLMAIKEKAKMLEPMANDAQKKTISEVNNYMQQVDAFGAQVKRDGEAKFEQNKAKWQDMLNNIFEKGGLENVMKLMNLKSATQCTVMAALIAPVILAFTR